MSYLLLSSNEMRGKFLKGQKLDYVRKEHFGALPIPSVHAQSHHLDIGARLKWGEQGPSLYVLKSGKTGSKDHF